MKLFYCLLITLFFAGTAAQAQYTRYIIQFTDKNGTPYTLSNPSAYLSAKSIERRTREHIALDSTDLPITPAYLDSIRSVPTVTILNVSKWLNQVAIKTTDSAGAFAKINSFPFVKASAAVAPRIASLTNGRIRSDKFTEPVDSLPGHLPAANMNREEGLEDNQLNYGHSFNQVHIHNGEFLHNMGFTGQGITIAMLDAGYKNYLTNPAFDSVRLQGRVLGTWDFVAGEASVNEDHWHGAYCFSILAANEPGTIVGTAPYARYWLLRTEDADTEYPIELQNWAAGAEFADSAGVDMITSSLGYADFQDPSFNLTYPERDGNTSIATRAADLAARKGIIVTNSAGNYGDRTDDFKYVSCPADGDSVVAVGATDNNGNIASFSSWGPNGVGKLKPNIVSVGQGTVFATFSGAAASGSGTSFSNPNICGLIACLWEAFPEYTNMEIIDAVQKSASRYNNPDDRFGYGLPDFRKAFCDLTSRSFSASINISGCSANITWTGKADSAMSFRIERKIGTGGFETIATIPGASNTFLMGQYTFVDSLVGGDQSDMVSYRIYEKVSPDTTLNLYSYTATLDQPCLLGNRLIVRPNPVQDNIYMILGSVQGVSHLNITLQDAKGSTCYQYSGATSPGSFYLTIPAAKLARGMYLLTIRDGNKKLFTRKLVK